MSAGPVPYARQVYQTNQVQASKGPEQRWASATQHPHPAPYPLYEHSLLASFSHTLPTDPAAKRIWENLTKRPYFVPPPATDRVPTRQSLSAPSSMQHRLPRPLSGHSLRSSERFTSLPVQQQLGTNAQPMTVSFFSAASVQWFWTLLWWPSFAMSMGACLGRGILRSATRDSVADLSG
eukprot:1151676-Pelagomonas_calceolata.AAC.12